MKLKSKKIIMLESEKIVSNTLRPRAEFDIYELDSLKESIKTIGIIEPLIVRKNSDKFYELIAGERRLRAAVAVGIKRVPCVLCEADFCQSALIALIENVKRTDLNFFEEAEALQRAIEDFSIDRVTLCDNLGFSQTTLSNKLALLRIEQSVRQRIIKARLCERQARALLRLETNAQNEALDFIIAEALGVKETENYVENLLTPKVVETIEPLPLRKYAVGDLRLFTNSIQKLVNSMQDSGIRTIFKKKESQAYVEFTVKISKASLQSKNPPYQMRIC